MIFRNQIGKNKVTGNNSILIGDELENSEPSKVKRKSPFEKNFLYHFHTFEHILDHTFSQLGLKEESVNHSVLLLEPLLNLTWSRRQVTELLFELYQAPKVAYAVDSLCSFNYLSEVSDGLIINSGHLDTTVIPVVDGKADMTNSAKINIGGNQATEHLMKSLNVRFPVFRNKITYEYVNELKEQVTVAAVDYRDQLRYLESVYRFEREETNRLLSISSFGSVETHQNVLAKLGKIKLEKTSVIKAYRDSVSWENSLFNDEPLQNKELVYLKWNELKHIPLTDEEIKAKERQRLENSEKLKELMRKKREEKQARLREEYQNLVQINAYREENKALFDEKLVVLGLSEVEFEKRFNFLDSKLNENEEPKEENKWALIDIPDEDLTNEQVRLKRMQKAQKSSYLARQERKRQAQEQQS